MPNMNNSSNEYFTRKLLNVNANNDVNKKKINTKNRGGIVAYIDKVLRDGINTTLDFAVPHARKEPLNPMAYVRDVNEWFLPSAQMALDEMEGRESYPKWSYLLASLPVVGKVAKPIKKVAVKYANPLTKAQKLEIIKKNNIANDDYHTWIRNENDILDFKEARKYTLDDIGDVSSYPDVTKEMLDEAEKSGKIKVYSSKPFSLGGFVSPSKMQAMDYAGNGKVYEGIFDIDDVAWINADEGQLVRVK